MKAAPWRLILRVIAFLILIVSIAWLIHEPRFEPLIVSLSALSALLVSIVGEKDKAEKVSRRSETRAQRNRRAMLELVRNFWVKGVLEQSLHGAAMIELGLEERADAVERLWDMVLQVPDQPNQPIPQGTKIVEVFNQMNQALLILGEPGSGKTTMLLDMAGDTIASAEEDRVLPIPVVFNLSSWAEKRQSIAEWLVDELNTKYYIPKKIARPWVEDDELLLLLDGLDEVKLEHREECVRAINDFRQEHLVPMAVCSRIADYEVLTTRLKLQGAVVLQALTPEQIDEYLDGAGVELLAVRATLKHDTVLQELVQSPLILSIMTLAYRGMSTGDLKALRSVEARRKHLFATYVQRMFERRDVRQPYSPQRTIHWLAWLAKGIIRHSQTVFLIEQMQPSWLRTGAQRKLYTIISRLVGGLVGGLVFGVVGGLVGGLTLALRGGQVFGLIGGLYIGLFATPRLGLALGLAGVFIGGLIAMIFTPTSIEPAEALKWSWKRGGVGLVGGLFLSLLIGLVDELCWGPGGSLLLGGLLGGLSGALITGLSAGLSYVERETKVVPNEGIRRSARNAVNLWLISGLVGGLISGLVHGVRGELSGEGVLASSLFCGLLIGFRFGGISVIQHFTLRFFLYRSGHLPWKLERFLDYAAERIFLRKVGGGYIFVHRTLMKHFASLASQEVKSG